MTVSTATLTFSSDESNAVSFEDGEIGVVINPAQQGAFNQMLVEFFRTLQLIGYSLPERHVPFGSIPYDPEEEGPDEAW